MLFMYLNDDNVKGVIVGLKVYLTNNHSLKFHLLNQ